MLTCGGVRAKQMPPLRYLQVSEGQVQPLVQRIEVLFSKVEPVWLDEFKILQRCDVVDALNQKTGQKVGRVVVKNKGWRHQGADVIVIVTEQGHLDSLCFTMGCKGHYKVIIFFIYLYKIVGFNNSIYF